jgi:hypothetical protein
MSYLRKMKMGLANLVNVMGKGPCTTDIRRGVSHCGLAIYIKKYLKVKKKYGNSCKNTIFRQILYKKPKSFKIS